MLGLGEQNAEGIAAFLKNARTSHTAATWCLSGKCFSAK
jgi:hypothetical protein